MILAIDPGKSGGFVWGVDSHKVNSAPMPKNIRGMSDLIRDVQEERLGEVTEVYLEQVGGYIGVNQPGSRMFEFGRNYGQLEGIITTLGIRIHYLTPRKWQGMLGLKKPKGIIQNKWKNMLKDRAKEEFPNRKVTLSTADAFLIYRAVSDKDQTP